MELYDSAYMYQDTVQDELPAAAQQFRLTQCHRANSFLQFDPLCFISYSVTLFWISVSSKKTIQMHKHDLRSDQTSLSLCPYALSVSQNDTISV